MAAWRSAGRLDQVGRMLVAAGDSLKGAVTLSEAGEYLEAAALFVRLGRYKEAADASYRGGDIPKCIMYLSVVGDHSAMAEVLFQFDMRDEAKAALKQQRPGSPGFVGSRERLADAELEDAFDQEAIDAFEELVDWAVEHGSMGPNVLRWLRRLAELELHRDREKASIAWLERAVELGVATDEVRQQLDKMRGAPLETRTVPRDVALDVDMGEDELEDAVRGSARHASSMVYPRHDRYTLLGKVGSGGYGIVYLAEDTKLLRQVVIKMFGDSRMGSDTAKRWFRREAQTAARLNHPNIVTVYDIGDIEDVPFIAMEYVEGTTLKEHLEDRLPIPENLAWRLLPQVLGAVAHAHDHGIVHRDIKLANMMISRQGMVKLMDFGLAYAVRNPEHSLIIAGTPAYMAPEQIHGMDVDHQTDVYALGVLIFKLFTGRFPFEDGNILEHQRNTPVPDPRLFNPNIPDIAVEAILGCMEKTKAKRTSDVRALARILKLSLPETSSPRLG